MGNREAKVKMIGIISILLILVFNVCIIRSVVTKVKETREFRKTYKSAVEDYNSGTENYDVTKLNSAYEKFVSIKGYKDSDEYISSIEEIMSNIQTYEEALTKCKSNEYIDAFRMLYELGDFRDSRQQISSISNELYLKAEQNMKNGDYEEASKSLLMIPEYAGNVYADAQRLLDQVSEKEKYKQEEHDYKAAVEKYNEKKYEEAQDIFIKIRDFENAEEYLEQIGSCILDKAQKAYANKEYKISIDLLKRIDEETEWSGYSDAIIMKDKINQEYKTYVNDTALMKLEAEGYDEFKSFVRNSVNEYFSETEAELLIEAHKPYSLLNMDTYADSGYIHVGETIIYSSMPGEDDPYKDNLGQIYKYGINRWIPNFSMEDTYVEYYVKDFSKFRSTIILNYEYRSEAEAGFIKIYGDGELVYCSEPIKKGLDPYNISIDISEYKVMRIEFTGCYVNGSLVEPYFSK